MNKDLAARFTKSKNNVQVDEKKAKAGFLALLFICFLIMAIAIWSLVNAANSSNQELSAAFFVLSAEGLFFAIAIILKNERSGIYLFEPFTIVTIVFLLVYFVAPVFQFAAGSTARYGVDVVEFCPAATALVMLGYVSFFIAYEYRIKNRNRKHKPKGVVFRGIHTEDGSRLVKWAYGIWAIAYLLNIYYYTTNGFGTLYVVLGGLMGAEDNSGMTEGSLAFLAYMKFILLGSWMFIYAYGRNKPVKITLYILTLLCMFLGGGRLTLLIALFAPIVFYYARLKKSPRIASVVFFVFALFALFAFMQVARVGLRSGAGLDLTGVGIDEMINPFYAEIDDFKSYYALLGVVPGRHDFLYGSQMIIYSLILLIPRAIFPAKPQPVIHDLVFLSLGPQAVVNGNAYPSIGEYYVEFGIAGVIVVMALFGVLCRKMKYLYLNSEGKTIGLMIYSILFPSLISILIRGYFPQNFSMLLFLLMPLGLFTYLLKVDSRRRTDTTTESSLDLREI